MKKIIVLLAVLLAFSGATLAAEGNNPNPWAAYITSGYGDGFGGVALGAEYNFDEDYYAFAELSVSDFDPFRSSIVVGADYEFIREAFEDASDWGYYVRGGAAVGAGLHKQPAFKVVGTAVAGISYDIQDAGVLFLHLRPELGINIQDNGNSNESNVKFRWNGNLAFGYRF